MKNWTGALSAQNRAEVVEQIRQHLHGRYTSVAVVDGSLSTVLTGQTLREIQLHDGPAGGFTLWDDYGGHCVSWGAVISCAWGKVTIDHTSPARIHLVWVFASEEGSR